MSVETRVSVSRVVGAVRLLGGLVIDNKARVAVSRVIGAVQLLAGPYVIETHIRVSRVIGTVSLTLAQPTAMRASVGPVIGTVRMYGISQGSLWSTLGLPNPHAGGYSYSNLNGLVRTQMSNGQVRQRVRWIKALRATTATFDVAIRQLPVLEELLTSVGAGWWDLPLITGDSTVAKTHTVRLVEPIDITALGDNRRYSVSMALEIL